MEVSGQLHTTVTDPVLCIISTSTDYGQLKLPDVTKTFHAVTVPVIVNMEESTIENL
jgi:hypothetical protein